MEHVNMRGPDPCSPRLSRKIRNKRSREIFFLRNDFRNKTEEKVRTLAKTIGNGECGKPYRERIVDNG